MQVGVVFPQTEIGANPAGLRDYVEAAQELGYRHLLAYDHVVGADPAVHKGWDGPYNVSAQFHEPFVLFGWLAGFSKMELVTGVLILPQRQTALVAKQAAQVDLLSGGNLRLGIGIGWNAVEYQALGKEFSNRGRRSEEQIELLRRLWTEPTVTFGGKFESVTGAGLAPLPVQRPIPIWIGGSSTRTYERIGRLADGWFPMVAPGHGAEAAREIVLRSAREAGRDPDAIGIEGRVTYTGDDQLLARHLQGWQQLGASHLGVNTMGAGRAGPIAHIEAIRRAAAVIDDFSE